MQLHSIGCNLDPPGGWGSWGGGGVGKGEAKGRPAGARSGRPTSETQRRRPGLYEPVMRSAGAFLMRAIPEIVIALVLIFIMGAGWGLLVMPGPHEAPRQINIARGQSLAGITRDLAAIGAVRSAVVFSFYTRLAGPVQAGEFYLPAGAPRGRAALRPWVHPRAL